MAGGCEPRHFERTALSPRAWAALGASLGAVALTLWSGQAALASSGSGSAFNPSVALPGGAGASGPGLAVNPDGSIVVIGSAGAGSGCTVVSLTHDGSTAKLLGRTAGGVSCSIAAGPLPNGKGELAYASQSADGINGGRSTNGGASFATADTSGPIAMGSMAADPLVNTNGVSTLYLLTRDPGTGLPRVAVSTDGGQSYSLSNSLVDAMHLESGLSEGNSGPSVAAGDLVARRDDTGLHLYAAFATPDGAADRLAQASAHTDNLNRVYEAVGTVTAAATGAAPTVSWTDHEVYAAPAGTALNALAPTTAVDAAGRVYTAFADSRHVYLKSDVDGTQWSATAAPSTIDTVASGAPAGLDGAAQPALAAGGNGMVDLAWYGATQNQWNVYMAQTLDGGSTWAATTVSDQAVHQGGALPANAGNAIALGIDQVTGAAVVAYAADQAATTTPSLFATRQCTGSSAVTGNALVDDCVAPQPATPVLPGSTCPGPQVNDAPGDALDTSAAGSGGSVPSFDITHAQLLSADTADEQLVLSLARLDAQLPSDVAQAWWRVSWTAGGAGYYAEATQTGTAPMTYVAGALKSDGSPGQSYAVQGTEVLGNSGQIRLTLPYAAMGNVAVGTTLHGLYAATYALFTVKGTVSTAAQLIDRAPDAGFGAPYSLGQACAPTADLPDVPAAALLPAVAGGAFLLWIYVRRRRSRRLPDESASSTPDVEMARGTDA